MLHRRVLCHFKHINIQIIPLSTLGVKSNGNVFPRLAIAVNPKEYLNICIAIDIHLFNAINSTGGGGGEGSNRYSEAVRIKIPGHNRGSRDRIAKQCNSPDYSFRVLSDFTLFPPVRIRYDMNCQCKRTDYILIVQYAGANDNDVNGEPIP